jgi:predicted NBD/HSP70 family sugar kinase
MSSVGGAYELLQVMRDGRPRTRSQLADITGMARTTVGLRVDALRELGLVVPVSDATSTGGRPSSQIAFNASARVVAAADLGATHARIGICDLSGAVLARVGTPLEITEGPEKVLASVRAQISALLEQIGRPQADLLAIGLGLPGPVQHSSGRPARPPLMPGWDNFDVPGEMQKDFAVPVLVDNDVNIMALGEYWSRQPPTENMIFVKVATGIGSGIISDGRLQRGADGAAGDIGHIPIARGAGIPCRCGKTGCVEAMASAPAITAALHTSRPDIASASDLIDRVRAGDLDAIRAVRQAGRDIGEVLNTCVSIVNPSVIAIGGLMAQAGEHLLAGIREVVYGSSTPLATEHLVIEQSRSGPDVGLIGASILAIEHALAPERLDSKLGNVDAEFASHFHNMM